MDDCYSSSINNPPTVPDFIDVTLSASEDHKQHTFRVRVYIVKEH